MSTSAASEFHAVDLDAVLDEFESSQTLEAANETTTDPPPKIMTRESVIDHETSLCKDWRNPPLYSDTLTFTGNLSGFFMAEIYYVLSCMKIEST